MRHSMGLVVPSLILPLVALLFLNSLANLQDLAGDAELRAIWTDPDFDPYFPAVNYARVLEIPTPTWQACDMAFYGHKMTAG